MTVLQRQHELYLRGISLKSEKNVIPSPVIFQALNTLGRLIAKETCDFLFGAVTHMKLNNLSVLRPFSLLCITCVSAHNKGNH